MVFCSKDFERTITQPITLLLLPAPLLIRLLGNQNGCCLYKKAMHCPILRLKYDLASSGPTFFLKVISLLTYTSHMKGLHCDTFIHAYYLSFCCAFDRQNWMRFIFPGFFVCILFILVSHKETPTPFSVLRIELRASHVLGKRSTSELYFTVQFIPF